MDDVARIIATLGLALLGGLLIAAIVDNWDADR